MSLSPSRPKVLTAAFVRSINRPGRYGDGRGGHGLSLLVKQTANGRWSKTWAPTSTHQRTHREPGPGQLPGRVAGPGP